MNKLETPEAPPIIASARGVGYIVCPTPRTCTCGRIVAMLVNRDGKARCLCCDETYTKERIHGS